MSDFETGGFQKVLSDDRPAGNETKRILLCTGKAYYELLEERQKRGLNNVALVRVEQFYPLEPSELMKVLEAYPKGTDLRWFQEEPSNMGAWIHMKMRFGDAIAERFTLSLISRAESASPSTGSANTHKLEQNEILDAAFKGL